MVTRAFRSLRQVVAAAVFVAVPLVGGCLARVQRLDVSQLLVAARQGQVQRAVVTVGSIEGSFTAEAAKVRGAGKFSVQLPPEYLSEPVLRSELVKRLRETVRGEVTVEDRLDWPQEIIREGPNR